MTNTVTISADELAELRMKAAQRDELAAVLLSRDWSMTDRVTMSTVILTSQPDSVTGRRTIQPPKPTAKGEKAATSIQWLSTTAGIHRNTISASLQKFAGAQLAEIKTFREWRNRENEPIPTASANKQRGDVCRVVDTLIAIPAKLPMTLPALGDSKRAEGMRENATAKRLEIAEMKATLDNLLTGAACPDCGEVGRLIGHISATCSACGTILDEQALSELVDGTAMPEQPDALALTKSARQNKLITFF